MRQKFKIKKGDNVKILVGKDNGKIGVVESILAASEKAIVKGMNVAKKHVKPSKKYPTGGIIDLNRGINISNLGLVCPNCGKVTRVAISPDIKTRICKKCNKSVEGGAK